MGWLTMRDFMTLEVKESANKRYLFECRDSKSPTGVSLFVKTEATHSGIVTGNAKFYRPDRMQDSAHTWTLKGRPMRPVLIEHDRKGACVGRVHKARYVDLSYQYSGDFPGVKGLTFYDSSAKKLNLFNSVDWVLRNLAAKPDYKGLGYIELDMNLTDPGAIQKVQDERFLTVSVSFATDAAICSVCHTDWATDDRCDHELGQAVDGKPMFLISGNFIYKECSFVNFPADPWAQVSNKETLRQVADSLRNRVFFMGLTQAEQQRRFVLDGADSLELTNSINFLGSDIQPVEDSDIEEDSDMDLKAIQAEIKNKELTKDRALALRTELAGAEDQASVKRTLSSLNAKIRANGWAEDNSISKDSVQAKIDGLAALLPTLADEDARKAYVSEVTDQAAALGLEFTPPAEAAPVETTPVAATDAVATPIPGSKLPDSVDKLLSTEDADKCPNKDKILKHVEATQALYGAVEDNEKYLVRSCMSALLEVFSADSWLSYCKGRLNENGDAVIPQSELDELHTAIEKYEAADASAKTDKDALLKTNLRLIQDQKNTLARMWVTGSVLLRKNGFTELSADQIQQEIGARSKRSLNSLQDALEDLLKELPAVPAAASESRPTEGAVRQVSDNAKVSTDGAAAAEAPAEVATVGEQPSGVLMKLLDPVAARRLAARNRFQARKNAPAQ